VFKGNEKKNPVKRTSPFLPVEAMSKKLSRAGAILVGRATPWNTGRIVSDKVAHPSWAYRGPEKIHKA